MLRKKRKSYKPLSPPAPLPLPLPLPPIQSRSQDEPSNTSCSSCGGLPNLKAIPRKTRLLLRATTAPNAGRTRKGRKRTETRSFIAFWRYRSKAGPSEEKSLRSCPISRSKSLQKHDLSVRAPGFTPEPGTVSPAARISSPKPKAKNDSLIAKIRRKVRVPPKLQRLYSSEEKRDVKHSSWENGRVALAPPCLVIHNGSYQIKAGLSTQRSPSAIFPSELGEPKYDTYGTGRPSKHLYIGAEVDQERRALKLRHPIDRGVISDWDDIEDLWDYTFKKQLRVSTSDYPLILTEPPQNPPENRVQTVKIVFETFQFPSFYLANQAVMSMYSSGKTTGLVAQIGHGMSCTVPVFEGKAVSYTVNRLEIAGADLTKYLADMMYRERGYVFNTAADLDAVKDLKQKYGYIALDPREEPFVSVRRIYVLPDGKEINIEDERFLCPELLFNPEKIGIHSKGIHQMAVDSVNRCNADFRKDLFSNVCISGGSSLFRGFQQRFRKELQLLDPKARVKVKCVDKVRDRYDRDTSKRTYSAWTGAAILASLSTFQDMVITRKQYDEFGPDIIHRWCCN